MRRSTVVPVLLAVLAASCGGGADSESTTLPVEEETTTVVDPDGMADAPAEFLLTESDHGAVLRVHPGDAITMKLAIEDPANPMWVIAGEPDPSVMQIGDAFLWTPSEPGADGDFFEFVFWVVGTGATDVTISLGPLTPTTRIVAFTVESTLP